MKQSRNIKPIRKCHNCKLNLGPNCAVYQDPRKMWHHRNCPGFNNEEMYAAYLMEVEKQEREVKKLKRQEAARIRDSEDHHQGTLPLANR